MPTVPQSFSATCSSSYSTSPQYFIALCCHIGTIRGICVHPGLVPLRRLCQSSCRETVPLSFCPARLCIEGLFSWLGLEGRSDHQDDDVSFVCCASLVRDFGEHLQGRRCLDNRRLMLMMFPYCDQSEDVFEGRGGMLEWPTVADSLSICLSLVSGTLPTASYECRRPKAQAVSMLTVKCEPGLLDSSGGKQWMIYPGIAAYLSFQVFQVQKPRVRNAPESKQPVGYPDLLIIE